MPTPPDYWPRYAAAGPGNLNDEIDVRQTATGPEPASGAAASAATPKHSAYSRRRIGFLKFKVGFQIWNVTKPRWVKDIFSEMCVVGALAS